VRLSRLVEGTLQAPDHGLDRDAAGDMSLGIEEHLHMPQALGVDPGEIGRGEVMEILLGPEHRHALVVEVEQILELGEAVSLAQRLDGGVGKRDAVAGGELKHELGLEAALDMHVQLAFGQPFDEARQVAHASASGSKPMDAQGPVAAGYDNRASLRRSLTS